MTSARLPGLDPVSPFLVRSDLAVSFADPMGEDEPLVWVNGAFCRLVGYGAEECEGRNCRFLQGEATDPASTRRIREGIDSRRFYLTPLVNYRANGERFTNGLLVGPVGDTAEPTRLLFGMQWDIDATLERRRRRADADDWGAPGPDIRLQHFERLIECVIDASRKRDVVSSPVSLVERLVAISRPQQYPPHERLPNWTRAGSLLPYLTEPYRTPASAEPYVNSGTEILAIDVAHPIALAVHEILSAIRRHSEHAERLPHQRVSCGTVFDGGESLFELSWSATLPMTPGSDDEHARATGNGLAVVAEVAALVGGSFETELSESGLETVLRVPNRLHEIGERGPAPGE